MQEKKMNLTEVWGDTADLKQLAIAAVICIAATMVFYCIGRNIFYAMPALDTSLAKGYSLLIGILGDFIACVISAILFKPKRIVEEHSDIGAIEDVIESSGMSVEEEANALATVDPAIIAEMERLNLYPLLALIPEGTPNYKAYYKKKALEMGADTSSKGAEVGSI